MKRIDMFFKAAELSALELLLSAMTKVLNLIYRRPRMLSGSVTVFLYRCYERLVNKTDRLEIRFVMNCLAP